jgi:hypothetical protein
VVYVYVDVLGVVYVYVDVLGVICVYVDVLGVIYMLLYAIRNSDCYCERKETPHSAVNKKGVC